MQREDRRSGCGACTTDTSVTEFYCKAGLREDKGAGENTEAKQVVYFFFVFVVKRDITTGLCSVGTNSILGVERGRAGQSDD